MASAPEVERSPPSEPDGIDACCSERAHLLDRIAALERELELTRKLDALRDAANFGTPINWGPGIPDAHRPERVQSALEEALRTCAATHRYTYNLECDEVPCLVWVEGALPLTEEGRIQPDVVGPSESLEGCPAWSYQTAMGGTSAVDGPDGTLETLTYFVVAADGWPGDEELGNVGKRFEQRIEERVAEFAEE